MEGGGAYVGLSEGATKALPPTTKASAAGTGAGAGAAVGKPVPYEYVITLACPTNGPTSGDGMGCPAAYQTCTNVPGASGPYVLIYRRTMTPADPPTEKPTPGRWENVGTTCWPDLVPNSNARPRLTFAMIKAQWRHTKFASPHLASEPPGGRTLVNLPTYFQIAWPTGFAPGSVDTTTLIGHQVRIKPTLVTNTMHFGDGASQATTSTGGPWPEGDIRHTYARGAAVTVTASTTYGGEYSVDGSPWSPINDTITITGPSMPLAVVTASDQLVNH